MVRGLAEADAGKVVRARVDGAFKSFDDFARRTGLGAGALKKLAQADAFRSLPLERRDALWRALPPRESYPLFAGIEASEPPAALPAMAPLQEVLADYRSAGLTLRCHPISFLRPLLDRLRAVSAAGLAERRNGVRVKVAGIVLLRQRPSTAKGVTFVTLEDETGTINLIVRQEVWERCRRVARSASVMLAHGHLQNEAGVIHVLVTKLEDLSAPLVELRTTSRDFR